MSGDIEVRTLPEADYQRWDTFVQTSSSGSIYSRATYLDVLCSVAGGSFEIVGAYRGDELFGGIALYSYATPVGRVVTNRLLLYYNGFVVADSASSYPGERIGKRQKVLSALAHFLGQMPFARVTIQSRHPVTDFRPFLAAKWQVRPNYSLVVDISALDTCWKAIDQNLKRFIKRSQVEGIACERSDDFTTFYRQHADLCERKKLPLYLPEQQFRSYFEKLSALGCCRLFHARLPSGESLASQLVLADRHPVTHTVCAASSQDQQQLGASAFLRWKVFEFLNSEGYLANDLTNASLDSVTRFKTQLGGNLS